MDDHEGARARQIPYKFVIDGTTWKEDAAAAEFADDGYGGKNSVVVVGGGARARRPRSPPPARSNRSPRARSRRPKIGANGVEFTFAGSARTSVAVCGDFNSWGATVNKMTQQADGTWTADQAPGRHVRLQVPRGRFDLEAGRRQSRHGRRRRLRRQELDHRREVSQPAPGSRDPGAFCCPQKSGRTGVPRRSHVLPHAPFARRARVALACTALLAAALPAWATKVTFFRYQPVIGGVSKVSVAGSFNAWKVDANPMSDPDKDGVWSADVEIPAGRVTWFVVNGDQWMTDENAIDFESDGLGGQNSVLVVTDKPVIAGHGTTLKKAPRRRPACAA